MVTLSGTMFKECYKCRFQWPTREDFLKDSAVEILGYQVFFEDLKKGMLLFNHSCGTTTAVHISQFLDLLDTPSSLERHPDGRDCPGRCQTRNIMNPCSPDCRCAFISRLINRIKGSEKNNPGSTG